MQVMYSNDKKKDREKIDMFPATLNEGVSKIPKQ
jgi:hypothetical protein